MNVLDVLADQEASLRKLAADSRAKKPDFSRQIEYRATQLANVRFRVHALLVASIDVVDSAKPSPWLDKLQDAVTNAGGKPLPAQGLIASGILLDQQP